MSPGLTADELNLKRPVIEPPNRERSFPEADIESAMSLRDDTRARQPVVQDEPGEMVAAMRGPRIVESDIQAIRE